MDLFAELLNTAVETGFLETALTAAGLPMIAAGVMVYRKTKKKKTSSETDANTTKSLLGKFFG